MKLFTLITLVVAFCGSLTSATASPEPQFSRQQPYYHRPSPYAYWPYDRHARTFRDFRNDRGNGVFDYSFGTENGIDVVASGRPGRRGQSNIVGTYSYQQPGGSVARVEYVADEFGYRPRSPLIPTPPPLPAHSLKQIRKAELERARGIRWY